MLILCQFQSDLYKTAKSSAKLAAVDSYHFHTVPFVLFIFWIIIFFKFYCSFIYLFFIYLFVLIRFVASRLVAFETMSTLKLSVQFHQVPIYIRWILQLGKICQLWNYAYSLCFSRQYNSKNSIKTLIFFSAPDTSQGVRETFHLYRELLLTAVSARPFMHEIID